jgi:dipeptidyl aminopeptidase/acylaminoacyl peptidase
MRKTLCGMAALATVASLMIGGLRAQETHAASPRPTPTPPSPALAYVSNGQVAVIEAGNLTVAGPGQNPSWSPNGANLMFDVPDLLSNTATIYLADKHGANTKALVGKAYPYINPSWSPDSKYVVFTAPATGTSLTGRTIQLVVRAARIADGATRTLGQFNFTAGCSPLTSALQDAFTKAQGGYHGTPNTLIWSQQANKVVVQSSCTGQGLLSFNVGGGGTKSLTAWSGGVLSPDGKTVVAAVAGAGKAPGKIGELTVASGATKLLPAKISPTIFAWGSNSKVLFALSQPADPATGAVILYRLSPDGKAVSILGQAHAAGAFHLSVNHLQDHLALAIVVNAARNAMAAPATYVSDAAALQYGTPSPVVPGTEPAWRP